MAATGLTGTGNVTTVSSTTGASATANKPANLVDGQAMVAFVYFRNSGGTITPPSGWNLLATVNTVDETFAAYVKPVPTASAESGASNYTWSTSAGSGRVLGGIFLVNGADLSSFQNAYGAQAVHTGTSSIVLPAVTTTAANKTLFAFAISNNTTTGSPTSFTPPAGMTTVFQVTVDNGTSATSTLWVGQEVVAASGSTGTRTVTMSPTAGNSGGFMMAVNGTNQPPTVAPIADQIKASGATASVTAVPSDVDGTISSHAWTVVKAPYGTTAPTLTNSTTATVTTSALSVGTTILQYIATDNSGLQSPPTYARLLVPGASAAAMKASRVKSNGGGWTYGGSATDLVTGVSASGNWIISPAAPTGAEITFEMEVPSTGTHTISFYADWLEADGTTQATGVLGSFTAQAFRNGVAISDVYTGSNTTGAPVQLTFTMSSGDNTAMNTDLTKIDIQLKATQA
jgi:hypothetical protein